MVLGLVWFVGMAGISAPACAAPITLEQAIHEAWRVDPLRHSLNIQKSAEQNKADAAHSWFPDGPVLSGQYFDDHAIGSNQGYTTYQAGVSVPVWLPGQRTATIREALSNSNVAAANLAMERMLIGLRVLEAVTQASLYKVQTTLLRQEKEALEHVVKLSARLLEQGEIANTDQDALVAWLEDVHRNLAMMEEQYISFKAVIHQLTMQDDVPDMLAVNGNYLLQHHINNLNMVVERDPRVKFAKMTLAAAEASDERVKNSYMPNPQVGVMTVHEKQYGSPWNTRVGVEMNVPLPSEARLVPMRMDAVKKIAEAENLLTTTHRAVHAEYIKLRARFLASIQVFKHASTKNAALEDRLQNMARAWSVGEVASIEYVRARQQSLIARREKAEADILWRSAIVRILITSGQFP